MQTRAPFEIPNASAAAFARTLFRSRSDTIKRQGDAWRGCRYKNIGSHSSPPSPIPRPRRMRGTIPRSRLETFSVGESEDETEKGRRKRKENGLQRREKFQSTIRASNSLFTSLERRGQNVKEGEVSLRFYERNFRNILPRFPVRLTAARSRRSRSKFSFTHLTSNFLSQRTETIERSETSEKSSGKGAARSRRIPRGVYRVRFPTRSILSGQFYRKGEENNGKKILPLFPENQLEQKRKTRLGHLHIVGN